jgi:hypothetical protein
MKQNTNEQAALPEDTQKAVSDLQKSWGDNAESNFKKIRHVAELIDSRSFVELMDQAECGGVKLGNHPAMIEMMLKIHDLIGSGKTEDEKKVPVKTKEKTVVTMLSYRPEDKPLLYN